MAEDDFENFVDENLKCGDEVREYFKNWIETQDSKVKANLGFFVFPQLVSLGCSIIQETSSLATNEKTKTLLKSFENVETTVIWEVAQMVINNRVRFNLDEFDSQSEVQLFFEAVNEDLKYDFLEWFGVRSEKFFKKYKHDMRRVICLLFTSGFAAISEGFCYLMDSAEDYPEFDEQIKSFYADFLSNSAALCSELVKRNDLEYLKWSDN